MFLYFLLGLIIGLFIALFIWVFSKRNPRVLDRVSQAKERLLSRKAVIIDYEDPVEDFLKKANE